MGNAHPTRRGISLTEVLISMFVLLIGLMGVAAMFPVGSYYIVRGEQLDQSAAVAQSAAHEMVTRGMLQPEIWRRFDGNPLFPPAPAPQPPPLVGIVIDPLGIAEAVEQKKTTSSLNLAQLNVFPRDDAPAGESPVRVTFADAVNPGLPMPRVMADLIFRARDDLSVDFPTRGDAPASLLYDDVTISNQRVPLRRQSAGEYSWLITIGPQYALDPQYRSITALPHLNYLATGRDPHLEHTVSVVVFHRRNLLFPTGGETELNEREVAAQILTSGPEGGEVRLVTSNPRELNGMRQGEWMMLFGQYPTNAPAPQRRWFLAWYRLVSMDLGFEDVSAAGGVAEGTRIVSLQGPQWPWQPNEQARAGLVAGAIAVHTKTMRLEARSPWSIPGLDDIGIPVTATPLLGP